MESKNRGAWWKLESSGLDLRRPEVIEHEAEMRRRTLAVRKHPRYWAHALGIALVLTQYKPVVYSAGSDGNLAWLSGWLLSIAAGAAVAGVLHLLKRPTSAQTGNHLVIAAWAVAVLIVVGSYQ